VKAPRFSHCYVAVLILDQVAVAGSAIKWLRDHEDDQDR